MTKCGDLCTSRPNKAIDYVTDGSAADNPGLQGHYNLGTN